VITYIARPYASLMTQDLDWSVSSRFDGIAAVPSEHFEEIYEMQAL
jgi:hypothetical protein